MKHTTRTMAPLALTLVLGGLLLVGCSQADAQSAPAASASGASAQRGEGAPYEILGSQVWSVPDPVSGRDYQVFVQLPPSYEREPNRRYPVLYVTDADYAFPLIRQISRRVNLEEPRIEEFILVGLSYAVGDDGATSRRRDYTPTPNGPSSARQHRHGDGEAYQTYLKSQVLPFIENRFRADPARRILLGHSYGSLLGAQILFSEPELFSGYILGSPSFWYDRGVMFTREAAWARDHRDLKAQVHMYIGEFEGLGPTPRHNRTRDMVADNRRMETLLRSRDYPGLTLTSEVLNDEDHLTVAPRGFTHGLLELLPAR